MRRFALATLTITAALALGTAASAGARAQTVQDYLTALREAPVTDAAAPLADDHCRPLMNFVYVEIPESRRSTGWIADLFGHSATDDATLTAKRDACLAVRRTPVISFTNTNNEPIVTPPELRDMSRERVW
ncbi:hypothetical protein [Azospirillum halopraeferens]|uniref:hypothetical protein n=1 Tax=Azospirillum halopraeferens TaxID=34010 RepID=UPI000412B044|nr:hypothetical protein [Azospirillum halopraeferens]